MFRAVIVLAAVGLAACGPAKPGRLTVHPAAASAKFEFENFSAAIVNGARGEPSLVISEKNADKPVWAGIPGRAFLTGGRGHEEVKESRGSFRIKDAVLVTCSDQTIAAARGNAGTFELTGTLLCSGDAVPWKLTLREVDGMLSFTAGLDHPSYNRIGLVFSSTPDEGFFGFGEQFTYFDQKGRLLPIFVQEQGVGRGVQPLTAGANLTAGAGGDWHTTYIGVPHFISSRNRSLFLENYEYSEFDMRDAESIRIGVFAGQMSGRIIRGSSPAELITAYTRFAGRMRALPEWVGEGAVIGMQGGTAKVREKYARLKAAGTPVSAFWLQDWVGQRKTSFGKQLWWNWELDRERYPEWENLVNDLRKDGVRVLLYINPFLVDVTGRSNVKRNLFAEARDRGFLVRNEKGEPYLIPNTDFSAGLVDLSNPSARAWMKEIIKSSLIGAGAEGWMADFGEALPYDAVLASGEHGRAVHNRYPEDWAALNREAVEEAGRPDIVFFMRSGYTRSPGKSALFWLGDQLVSWDEYDGIKTAVTGLLSGGMSGFSLNHSDIGGYTTITHPLRNYHRTKELQMRWAELSAFTTAFRTHEGNRPDENHQFDSDDETLRHFTRMARLFKVLAPVRRTLILEAGATGIPVNRPLFLHYPADTRTREIRYEEFLLGPDILVAPVTDQGQTKCRVYLPGGQWTHFWTQKEYGTEKPSDVEIDAPIGKPCAFVRSHSKTREIVMTRLLEAGL